MNDKTRLVFESVAKKLPSVQIARGHYSAINSKRVGLHTTTATHFDLAALLFLAAEQVDNNNRDSLFHSAWLALRSHFSWDKRQNNSDVRLCAFLDGHSKEWHVEVVGQVIVGQEYNPRSKSAVDLDSILNEYV